MITIGSLFDGIGGFPLAAQRNGMTAIWASEIEPFPIRVTQIRFPDMKHLGDITKIDGAEIEPVDIITGGSPCQDLSVAGKRAGMKHTDKGDEETTRSGLFMEQVRIVREMRENEKRNGRTGVDIRPRFMVWENVPGAFSSNKGEDFRAVLEELCKVSDKTVIIPKPPKGKWSTVGAIMGNGYSIAWRVLDAQYWGVPQRRRRIYLVADFGGQSAPEILFKREGNSRNFKTSSQAREKVATDAERSIGEAIAIDSNRQDGRFKLTGNIVPTIPAKAGTGGNNGPMLAIPINDQATHANGYSNGSMIGNPGEPMYSLTAQDKHSVAVMAFDGYNQTLNDKAQTIRANKTDGDHVGMIINCQASGISGTVSSKWAKGTGGPAGDEHYNLIVDKVAKPLSAQSQMHHRLDMDNVVCSVDCRNMYENMEKSGTLQSKPNGGQSLNYQNPIRTGYSVRRLTPLECERLQDFPDGWTDIPGASDSARYKALGNSIAVCCAEYVMEGIKEAINQ